MTGFFQLYLEASKKLVHFEITAEDKVIIDKVESVLGRNLPLEVLDFNLGEIITSHSADGKSIYIGKFGAFGAHGLGIKLEEESKYSAGYFSRGKLNGVCKVILPENDIFIGNMNEDFPEGEGLFYDAQSKLWLYGYFKNFECITLLKDQIQVSLPYKRRIFANQYEKSRTCDRCAIDIPLYDFAKEISTRFEPYLDSLRQQLQDGNPTQSSPTSVALSSRDQNKSDHIKIKEVLNNTDMSKPAEHIFEMEPKGKDTLKLLSTAKRGKSNKKSLSAENSERVFTSNSEPWT